MNEASRSKRTSNPIQLFNYEAHDVRVLEANGEPRFVGKDVCGVLEYRNPADAMKQHCRGVAEYYPIADGLGRVQQTRILRQADVLRLIVGSTLPAAQRFEEWIFDEVLPSIMHTGSYSANAGTTERTAEVMERAFTMLEQSFAMMNRAFERMMEQNRKFEPKPRRKITAAEREEIFNMAREGHGPTPIGDALDISPKSVSSILSRARATGQLELL